MDVVHASEGCLHYDHMEDTSLQPSLRHQERSLSADVFTDQYFQNVQKCNYFDLRNSQRSPDLSAEKMLCVNNDPNLYSKNPFKFSSIWILFTKDRDCKLLSLEDLDVLLPDDGRNIMISKSYIVNMHFTSSVVDHYSKEIDKLLSEENYFVNLNNNSFVCQISCLPNGSRVTLFVVTDEIYKLWLAGRNIERCELLVQSLDLKEVLYELQNMKEMFRLSEENIKNNVIKYINLNGEDANEVVDAVNLHIARIDSAVQISDNLNCGVTNKWLFDAANTIKESQISVTSLVQCNNLLIAENANVCNKYELLKTKLQYGDSSSKEELSKIKDDFLSQSNERLRFKLISLMNHMEELQIKFHQSEQQNLTLSEQLMKIRLEKEQQILKLHHEISNSSIENMLLKKDIAEKDCVIKETVSCGKTLLEDINSIENLLQSVGKDVIQSISHIGSLRDEDALPYVMNTFRNCVNDFSRTILAAHNKAESSERSLSQIKVEFNRVTEEFTDLSKEVCSLKEKLYLLNGENMDLLNNVSELAEENSLLQEQLSQSNFRNILLNDQLNELKKQKQVDGGKSINKKLSSEKSESNFFQENINILKRQVEELMNEKHKLLERVHDAEARAKKFQYDLQHKEFLLNETIENYESYIFLLKKDAVGKEVDMSNSQPILQKFIEGVKKEHSCFIHQIKSLQNSHSNSQGDQNVEKAKFDDGIKILKEAVGNFTFYLNEESLESIGMKQLNHIQQIFSAEEINLEAEIENLIECECNETLIGELEMCLDEKENLIVTLQAQGESDRNELEQVKECAFRWKKQLQKSRMLLKHYKEKKNDLVCSQNKLYQALNKTIEDTQLKYEILVKECQEKSMEIAKLEDDLRETGRKFENLKNSYHADKKELGKEVNIAKKRLSEYEKHVGVLDKELERQVKLVEETVKKADDKIKELKDQILKYGSEVILLKSKLSEKDAEVIGLKEMCKKFDDECSTAKNIISECQLKYNEVEEIILDKNKVIKNFENEKQKTEEMLVAYNKMSSDLIKEQRKIKKLESEVQLLVMIKHELENKLKEKEDLLHSSFNDLQFVKKELAEIKNNFKKNSCEVLLLESKHNQEKMSFEHALNKCRDEKKAIENSYNGLLNERSELLKEHDALCDKLINAIHMLMENKLVRERMEVQIRELSDTVSILKKRMLPVERNQDRRVIPDVTFTVSKH